MVAVVTADGDTVCAAVAAAAAALVLLLQAIAFGGAGRG